MPPVDIDKLIANASFPHPVKDIQVIETHISWVLLTGDYAYKLKKPVDFGFIDFSSTSLRNHFCRQELELNRRFSDNLYLDIMAIKATDNGWQFIPLDQCQKADQWEHAVQMRQFSQSALLLNLIQQQALSNDDWDQLGWQLGRFHQHANIAPTDSVWGGHQAIDPALANFTQCRQNLPLDDDSLPLLSELQQWTEQRFTQLQDLLQQRKQQGLVRECHGDLHLGNIAKIEEQLTFFDCIEFSESLRWIDCASELAFLLMDLHDHQASNAANRVLNAYLEYSGDYEALRILDFFLCYRAMVRAKVALLSKQRPLYLRYLTLAKQLTRPQTVSLTLTYGLSGSGKTTIAKQIAAHTGAVVLRSDVERKRLFGLRPLERSQADKKASLYSNEASAKTFAKLLDDSQRLLAWGYPVIVDATFLSADSRLPFAQLSDTMSCPFTILHCQTPTAIAEQWLQERAHKGNDASEADHLIRRRQYEQIEPLNDVEQAHRIEIHSHHAWDINHTINQLIRSPVWREHHSTPIV